MANVEWARWLVLAAGVLLVLGTALGFSHSAHWAVRVWDFPRLQIALALGVVAALHAAFYSRGSAFDAAFLVLLLAAAAWQLRKVHPYTPLAPLRVQRSSRVVADTPARAGEPRLRVVVSNVLMENQRYGRFLEMVRQARPDVVLALETDAAWAAAIEPLTATHPFAVRQPLENYYGMMLFSRLPLREPRVDFLVQDDIPSIHTGVELPSGDVIRFHGLHPRPPEPIRMQDSTPRDAELVLMGRRIREAGDQPTVVAGDLNDVAWSHTSELFLRLSGLLDPRVGRGMYSSYNANSRIARWPLDYIFHSCHFRLVELRRLPNIGSDHFPILMELSYEPDAAHVQPPSEVEPGDLRDAAEHIAQQREAADTGGDQPRRDG